MTTVVRHARPASSAPTAVGGGSGDQRTDIQGLRAIAVLAVLLYHLWPKRLTGGFVGVDVFFVISGFLITSHLLRRPIRSGHDLLGFWARRVRRLIPAASLVLLVTLVASVIWLPETVRATVSREVLASAFYVENWALAWSATDYLAAEAMHTPVQHYWSLSVEEQFYIVWPVLLGLAVAVGARWRRGVVWAPAAVVGAVVAASFAWSVHLTGSNPAAAYFVSTTRFWELGVGALLATLLVGFRMRLPAAARAAMAWVGLAMIGVAVVTFTASTPFPGASAALPTVGTALVIAAAADGVTAGPGRALGMRPVQWVGDVSYSLYLWHWPLIVIAPFALGHDLAWPEKIVLLFAAGLLAVLSKRLVEDPLRSGRRITRGLRPTFLVLLACLVVVGGAAGAVYAKSQYDARAAESAAQEAAERAAQCLGAGAVRDSSCDLVGDELVTTPAFAKTDMPVVYEDDCWNLHPFDTRISCTYGSDDPEARVAVVGNSHAGHWVPAMLPAIEADRWQLTTFLQSNCYTVEVPIVFSDPKAVEGCVAINRWAIGEVSSGEYDLVVMSDRSWEQLVGVSRENKDDTARDSYAAVLERITASGTPVLVVRDTPAASVDVPDCLAADPQDISDCGMTLEQGLERDPLAEAAEADTSGLVTVLDLNDTICPEGFCSPVIGGVITYFDHGHLSATFASTMAPEMTAALESRIRRS
ncbi:acyltransferase family protein [Cellulosimicrobium cellulans]|uniref:acyltransferase family protein n=1 Tax=Cellulosimicrobium cellulans TaxID=1710 RepID=UPI0036E29822